MIVLHDVTKSARAGRKAKPILSGTNLEIPTDRRIALLGEHDGHKRTLIHLLGGVEKPTVGRIARYAEVSFPVGFLPGLTKELSVRANVAHIARLYSADVNRTSNLVEMILNIGRRFDRSYGELDAVERRYLSEIVPLCLPFDTYLLTDDKLVQRWRAEQQKHHKGKPDVEARIAILFNARLRSCGMIIPTTDIELAREHCDMFLTMDEDRLTFAESSSLAKFGERRRPPKRRERAI